MISSKDMNLSITRLDCHTIQQHSVVGYTQQHAFILCQQGSVSLRMDDHLYNVGEGDIYIFPAFSQTDLVFCSRDFKAIFGSADFEFVLKAFETATDPLTTIFIRFHPHTSLSPIRYRRIHNLITLLSERRTENSALMQPIVAQLANALCLEIIDAFVVNHQFEKQSLTRRDMLFHQFIAHLQRNCQQNRNVQFYANLFNLTPRYFSTIIKQKSGQSPQYWISHFVILEAKRLLSSNTLSIKEISDQLNFPDQSYFGRYFRLYAGMSPSEFIRTKQSFK